MSSKIKKQEETVADILKRIKKEKAQAERKARVEAERRRRQEEQASLPPWMRKKKPTSVDKRIKEQQEKMLDKISKVYIVSVACLQLGVSRATLYRWINEDPEYKRKFKEKQLEGKANVDDMAESTLLKKVQAGESKALFYYLSRMHPNYRNGAIPMVEEKPTLTSEQMFGFAQRLALWKTNNLHVSESQAVDNDKIEKENNDTN